MARVIVGYEGGRPVFRDEGPARGRVGDRGGGDAISRIGAQVLPTRFLTGGDATHGEQGGAGDVERRQLTAAERAARARSDDAPSPIAPRRTPASIAESRARGAARAGFVKGAPSPREQHRPPVPTPPVEPHHPREESPVVEPVAATPVPEIALPCPFCVKADVCGIRPTLLADDLVVVAPLRDGVRIAEIRVACEFFVDASPAILAPEPPPTPKRLRVVSRPTTTAVQATVRGKRRGPTAEEISARDRRAAEVLKALDAHHGDTKLAGAQLGLRSNVVARIAQSARQRAAQAVEANA